MAVSFAAVVVLLEQKSFVHGLEQRGGHLIVNLKKELILCTRSGVQMDKGMCYLKNFVTTKQSIKAQETFLLGKFKNTTTDSYYQYNCVRTAY